ncbi:MAG: bifunctional 2',3'-cyclic-nucleotide 2'-phosphodiesterase/3'-nucleotidase [Pseudomonadota bacterium]
MRTESEASEKTSDGTSVTAKVHLRLLCVTDLHAHVLPYNYYINQHSESVGLARTASLIRAAKKDAGNTLVLDNGDFLQGTPLADYVAETSGLPAGSVHPVISAMNAAGIEVGTLGNHEFNYGLPFLERSLEGAAFPIVSANIFRPARGNRRQRETLLSPYVVLKRRVQDTAGREHPLRIGVIGFAPPQLVEWDSAPLAGQIETQDIRESARHMLPRLRAEGADLVVALCHSGFGSLDPQQGAENAALGLAQDGGIDALFAGHAHLVFPSADFASQPGLDIAAGTAAGVPAVMAGANGSQLGIIDLQLKKTPQGWSVGSSASSIAYIAERPDGQSPVGKVGCDPAVKADALDTHRATLVHIQRPIGRIETPLSSALSVVAPCPCASLIAHAQKWYFEQHLTGPTLPSLPILSAAASFKTGGRGGPENYTDIPPGPLSWRHASDLYPFPNRLCAVVVTGAELILWLERAAGIFNKIGEGDTDCDLLDAEFPPYNFDQIIGLNYIIDPSQPALFSPDGKKRAGTKGRIQQLRYKGKQPHPDEQFLVLTNDYRANGGGQFPGTGPERVVYTSAVLNRDILISYIESATSVPLIKEDTWRFAPVSGASALLDTHPRVDADLRRIDHMRPDRLGMTDGGFQRLRINLA